MFKSTIKVFVVVFLVSNAIWGQNQQNAERTTWERFFSGANETAIWDNGRVIYFRAPTPAYGEKSFSLQHRNDLSGFSLQDEKGLSLGVSLYNDRRIRSIEMPDGRSVNIRWKQMKSGDWIPEKIECLNTNVRYVRTGLAVVEGSACEDALAAVAIAAGVCAVSPGSLACWAATATAAYHTFRCYKETHPSESQNEALLHRNTYRKLEARLEKDVSRLGIGPIFGKIALSGALSFG